MDLMRKRRILFLVTGGLYHSSTRFRVYQYLPYLEQSGKFEVVDVVPVNTHQRLGKIGHSLRRIWQQSRDSDVVFVQKLRLPPPLLRAITRGKRLIYDFDDAIHLPPPRWPANKSYQTRRKLADATIRNADHVIAGNTFLAQYAQALNPTVTVVPTVADTGLLSVDPKHYIRWSFRRQVFAPAESSLQRTSTLIVGWIGGSGSLRFLDSLVPVLRTLQREHHFELRVVSDEPWEKDGLMIANKPWSLETEVADVQGFDIGIMPLDADNPFVLGKCGFKLIEYMACGKPTVATAVGVNTSIVDHGVDGFLAQSQADWSNSLRLLLEDAELRSRIGQAARKKIEERYSIASVLPKLTIILSSV